MINVEAHAAHCPMASTIIIKKNARSNNGKRTIIKRTLEPIYHTWDIAPIWLVPGLQLLCASVVPASGQFCFGEHPDGGGVAVGAD